MRSSKKIKDFLNADNFIISANSGWKAIFDTIVLFVVAYSIFSTLLVVSFDPEVNQTYKMIDNVVLVIFILDFVLSKLNLLILNLN